MGDQKVAPPKSALGTLRPELFDGNAQRARNVSDDDCASAPEAGWVNSTIRIMINIPAIATSPRTASGSASDSTIPPSSLDILPQSVSDSSPCDAH